MMAAQRIGTHRKSSAVPAMTKINLPDVPASAARIAVADARPFRLGRAAPGITSSPRRRRRRTIRRRPRSRRRRAAAAGGPARGPPPDGQPPPAGIAQSQPDPARARVAAAGATDREKHQEPDAENDEDDCKGTQSFLAGRTAGLLCRAALEILGIAGKKLHEVVDAALDAAGEVAGRESAAGWRSR